MEDWDVFVIAGASGVGKSHLSYQLARRFGAPIVEVDDLFRAIESVTTPEQHPAIHYWRTHPEAAEAGPERILELLLDVSRAMRPAVAAVIRNHIETRMPIVLEGDYILPECIADFPDRVKSVFLIEDDPDQLVRNLLAREPEAGEQRTRADVGVLFSRWLIDECRRHGTVVLPVRPWDTLVARATSAVP